MLRCRFIPVILALFTAVVSGGAASAEGVTRIQQSDGTTQIYHHVTMELAGHTLFLHSHDHKGVLEVTSEACSYRNDLQRCLPYKTMLRQHGKAHEIALEHGSVYLNLTDSVRRLPRSSEQLGPREILVLLHTIRGTYISVKGTLDQVK